MHHRVLHAPVKDGKDVRCLDVGCGTGVVTDTIATAFPQAQCYGLDLSPVPVLRARKSNVRFFQGNISTQRPSQWTADDGGVGFAQDREVFDYIFGRLLVCGMTDWPSYVQTQFDLLKPGGWAEVHDHDWTYFNDAGEVISNEWFWLQGLSSICEGKKGMDLRCGSKAAQWMEQAGFGDIRVARYKWSYDPFEKEPGVREFAAWHQKRQPPLVCTVVERAFTSGLGAGMVDHETIVRMQEDVLSKMAPQRGKHAWFYVTIGRKPEVP
ncbi:S-adenosyl-L-methionine-dependent methyltransferase [Neohortaea acidophila]|uniref:S-adenosyl-L-methionine-dependent methyltransferase n=1 Tax=Neohortaea acidophila TaxID=245834 RepID=A0A6A6PQ78_9PEZI|nr:S-adenosyl-L-methionine-dependent methyltransferase [Neohortaea acidophila]KAF2482162.1 S-adenosyl-L-methionine-dependent methyltransferase [Neohortaea acidophila]